MKNLKNFLKINGLTNDPNQQEHKFESAIHKKHATKTITLSNQQKTPLILLDGVVAALPDGIEMCQVCEC